MAPICMDDTTNKLMFDRSFGYFARILVDMAMFFFLQVVYENLSNFSDHCQIIEHNVGNCRRITKHNIDQNKDEVEKKSNRQEHGQIYVIKEKPQQQPIHISSSSKDPSQQENEISTGGKKVSTTKGPVIEGDINHDVGSTKDQAEFLETQVNPHITLTITQEGQSSTESEFVDATSKMTQKLNLASKVYQKQSKTLKLRKMSKMTNIHM